MESSRRSWDPDLTRNGENGRRSGLDALTDTVAALDGYGVERGTGWCFEERVKGAIGPPINTVLGAPFDGDHGYRIPWTLGLT
ncbi:MAG: hypothetical protein V1248_07780 [Acidimicrobiales bacterium]|nr:hypothetical protein [Acidimicrobiales bacterium]